MGIEPCCEKMVDIKRKAIIVAPKVKLAIASPNINSSKIEIKKQPYWKYPLIFLLNVCF
jgi:hypothetical protein